MLPTKLKGLFKSFIVGFISIFIVACSGEGSLSDGTSAGGGSNGGTTSGTYALASSLTNSEGLSGNEMASGEQLRLLVTLTLDGNPVSGEEITFTNSDLALSTLSNTTVTTNSDGEASVTITATDTAGTGQVTVTSSITSLSEIVLQYKALGVITAVTNYAAYLIPESTLPSDYDAVTGNRMTMISVAEPGKLLVKLLDDDLQPLSRQLVYVQLGDDFTNLAKLSVDNGAIATDENGFATIGIEATDVSGAGILNVSYQEEIVASVVFESAGDGNQTVSAEIGSVELLADSFQMASSGASKVTLSALVKDTKNNLMQDVTVSFETTSGGIQVTNSMTGPDGLATAVLDTRNAPENRIINVIASVDDKSDNLDILVTGTTIKVVGSSSIVTGNSAVFSVSLLDSDGNGIGNRSIYLSSANGNALTDSNGVALAVDETNSMSYVVTDATGTAQFKYVASTSGNDKITASSLGEINDFNISVSPDKFEITELKVNDTVVSNSEVPMIQGGIFKLVWEKDSTPFVGDVLFSTTRGQIFEKDADTEVDAPLTTYISTDAAGMVEVKLVSSNAGPAILTAKATGLTATFEFEFVAETAHQVDMKASPVSIGPNGQQSTISAVVRDVDGNLVKNRPINFKLYDVGGGELFPATDTTDSNGLATTIYTSNTVSSLNGVVVVGCTDTEGAESNCSISRDDQGDSNSLNDTYNCQLSGGNCLVDDVSLTVAERELFINVGLGDALGEASEQEYLYEIPVSVTDVNSNPIAGVELTVSAVPTYYRKGFWVKELDDADEFVKWVPQTTVSCTNEDVDRDGILDVEENGVGINEDRNNNNVLDPGNMVTVLGNFVTDSQGSSLLSIRYAQSSAIWIVVEFVVSAKMAGTEHSSKLEFSLPIINDAVTDEKFPPRSSLFGTSNSCTDVN